MRSPRKATIVFVAILLLFLLSFVSAELNKRDPQEPGGGGGGGGGEAPPKDPPPAKDPPAKDPPAKDPPAGGKAPGDAPAAPPGGGETPPATGGNPPGGNPPGGNPPGGNPPGGTPPADNSTTPKYIDPLTPTVQVKILDPKSAKNILFKIGAKVKFRWEYSDVFLDPPKYITVAAQPAVNTKTNYTIAQNITVNTTQEVIWDTSTQPALPMSQYKLLICDQDGMNAPPKPGGLQPFSGLTFVLYSSQDTGSVCADGCSNAISIPIISLPTIGLALITIISLSFILI